MTTPTTQRAAAAVSEITLSERVRAGTATWSETDLTIHRTMGQYVRHGEENREAFAKEVAKNPTYAMEWSGSEAVQTEWRLQFARTYEAVLNSDYEPDVPLPCGRPQFALSHAFDVLRATPRQVLDSVSSGASTSAMKNEIERLQLVAKSVTWRRLGHLFLQEVV